MPSVRLASRHVVLHEAGGPRVGPALLVFDRDIQSIQTPTAATPYEALAAKADVRADHSLVTPAFVNAHTHLALGFLRGAARPGPDRNVVEDLYFPVERALTAEDVRAFAAMGAYECLLNGVGFVWDHFYFGASVAQALTQVGLSGAVAPTLQDEGEGPGTDRLEEAFESTKVLAESAAFRDRGVFACWGPHATDTVSDALWQRLLVANEARNLPLHLHLAQSVEEFSRSRARWGETPVQRLHRLGVLEQALLYAHGLYVTEADLGALDPVRHVLAFCPRSQCAFGFPPRLSRWTTRGFRVCLGTDDAPGASGLSLGADLQLGRALPSGATAWTPAYDRFAAQGTEAAAQALWHTRSDAVTPTVEDTALTWLERLWGGASTLHPEVCVGVLAPGALANVVVWDLRHPAFWPAPEPWEALAWGDATPAIQGMWVAGVAVGAFGDFHRSVLGSADYQNARAEADDRLQALRRRLRGVAF